MYHCRIGVSRHMEDATDNTKNPHPVKIPPKIAARLRALLHDMGNALEIVVQSEYLLSMGAETPEDAKTWLDMLHQGTQQAIQLNQALREYVRAHDQSLL